MARWKSSDKEEDIGSYNWYEDNYSNPNGQELDDYTPQKWSGLTQEQWETKERLETERSDEATRAFYDKYGIEYDG